LEQTHEAYNFAMYHCINELLFLLIYGLERITTIEMIIFLASLQGGHSQESIMVFNMFGVKF
jgi:hypothetical protein